MTLLNPALKDLDWSKVLPYLSVPGEDSPLELGRDCFHDTSGDRFYPILDGVPQFMDKPMEKKLIDHFDENAKIFGKASKAVEVVQPIAALLRKELSRIIGDGQNSRVLVDVGVGHGQFSAPFTSNHTVFGVDVSHEMLKLTHDTGIYPILADGVELPLRSQSIDCSYTIEVLQLFENPLPILAEMTRILKPGGSLIISTLYRYSLLRRLNRLIKQQSPDEGTRLRRPHDVIESTAELPLELVNVSWLMGPTSFTYRTNKPNWIFSPLASNILIHLKRKSA